MRLPETRDLFSRRLTFPVDHDRVVESVGDVEIEAPYGEDESIEEIISRGGQPTYDSIDELYDTLIACVGDAYIGRKHYDDRGSQAGIDHEEVSF